MLYARIKGNKTAHKSVLTKCILIFMNEKAKS